jgi:hypothetical protein
MDMDFTYTKPNEERYLSAVIVVLKKKGSPEVADLLVFSKCTIIPSSTYGRRWNAYLTTVDFAFPPEYFEKASELIDNMKDILGDVCNQVMPQKVGFDVSNITVSISLEDNTPTAYLTRSEEKNEKANQPKIISSKRDTTITSTAQNKSNEASTNGPIEVLIERKLRKVIREKPTSENQVQDALENLFIGSEVDDRFTREKEHVIYSCKTYIPDFVFHDMDTVVEAKFCDKVGREKELVREINDDIMAYKTKYSKVIFVLYDTGIIRNEDEFKKSLEKQDSVIVKIVKH